MARWLTRELNLPVRAETGIPWQARDRLLEEGKIDLGWICGAPYVEKAARGAPLELLAAPIMQRPRYRNLPVYYSDVVARADSPIFSFRDLAGRRWAYNEPGSHSGYHAVRYFLSTLDLKGDFFGQVIESGSHQRSIELILEGSVDASAIDSTVLEQLCALRPELIHSLRVITTIGPSPIPPFVIGTHVPRALRDQIRAELISLDESNAGRALLARAGIARFTVVHDRDYNPIREMLYRARAVSL